MNIGSIALTDREQEIFDRIEFDAKALIGNVEAVKANGARAAALTTSLIERGAIPEARRQYFTDPAYHVGGHGNSRQDSYKKNGVHGAEIFAHISFLNYLHYFIHGSRLPRNAIDAFCREVANCGQVTSGDVIPLGKFAREQARSLGMDRGDTAEEFFKLALDCDIGLDYALHIRQAVKRLPARHR